MEYVRLGRTGLRVSRLCLGCMTYGDPGRRDWVLPEAEARPFFERALEAGVNFFDTAEMYSLGVSEEITGRALRALTRREGDYKVVDRVAEVAAARGVQPAPVALAWLLHHPGVTAPIVGATRLEPLDAALAAVDLRLERDELRRLEEPHVPHPVLGH